MKLAFCPTPELDVIKIPNIINRSFDFITTASEDDSEKDDYEGGDGEADEGEEDNSNGPTPFILYKLLTYESSLKLFSFR